VDVEGTALVEARVDSGELDNTSLIGDLAATQEGLVALETRATAGASTSTSAKAGRVSTVHTSSISYENQILYTYE
jgi:hypothetical protein